jgi:CDP-diacylglycerol--serine O-phosphatidyltransferase
MRVRGQFQARWQPFMTNDSPDPAATERSRPRSRSVYLLPNLFTTAVLFSGFYAIVAATDGNFDRAGIAVFIAMVCDGLDGRIARWTNTQSEFGKEYDSLSDMVAFGLAPAVVAYQWGVARIAEYGFLWGRLGWLATFFYAACAAIRLARFNARAGTADKRYFEGLPSPSGAALLAGFVWMLADLQREGLRALILIFAVALVAGSLMVSRFRYLSGKDLDPTMRIPVAFMVLVPLGFVLVGTSPPEMLFGLFAAYALSGPIAWAWRRFRRRHRAARPPGTGTEGR